MHTKPWAATHGLVAALSIDCRVLTHISNKQASPDSLNILDWHMPLCKKKIGMVGRDLHLAELQGRNAVRACIYRKVYTPYTC